MTSYPKLMPDSYGSNSRKKVGNDENNDEIELEQYTDMRNTSEEVRCEASSIALIATFTKLSRDLYRHSQMTPKFPIKKFLEGNNIYSRMDEQNIPFSLKEDQTGNVSRPEGCTYS